MIDPSTINLSSLPWLPLDARSAFPRQPAIYFAIDSQNQIQYIGISKDPKARWVQHHRYEQLQEIGGIRVTYLFVDDASLLKQIEDILIERFQPLLNVVKPIEQATTLSARRGGMRNKIDQLIGNLGITAYRFAEQTGITRNTVYLLKNNPSQFPSGEIFDRIIETYNVSPDEIVEWVPGDLSTDDQPKTTQPTTNGTQ